MTAEQLVATPIKICGGSIICFAAKGTGVGGSNGYIEVRLPEPYNSIGLQIATMSIVTGSTINENPALNWQDGDDYYIVCQITGSGTLLDFDTPLSVWPPNGFLGFHQASETWSKIFIVAYSDLLNTYEQVTIELLNEIKDLLKQVLKK